MQNKNNNDMLNLNDYYTAYIVRDRNARKFLNKPVYSGRLSGIWGKQTDAQIFFNRKQASSCASNINHRRPDGYSAYYAEVRPVLIRRQRAAQVSQPTRR
jgi:hypothetical protein